MNIVTVNTKANRAKKEIDRKLSMTENLFTPQNLTTGVQINPDTGEEIEHLAYSTSDFIDVKPNTDYYIDGTHGFHRYDDNGNWLSGTTNDTGARNSREATKVRISVLNSNVYNLMMVEGDTAPTQYIEHGYDNNLAKTQYQRKIDSIKEGIHFDSFKKEPALPFEKIDLLTGAGISSNNRVVINDEYTLRYQNRRKNYRLDLFTSVATVTFGFNSTLDLMGVSEFVLVVYVEDAAQLDNLVFDIPGTSWTRGPIDTIKTGWNILRYQANAGDISTWNTADALDLDCYFNTPTTVYVSDIYAIKHEKAKILFINDHGYHGFKETAYPQLKALGIPTTWALNPGRLGESVSTTESILTQADIDELAYDPYSEFSIHNWSPSGNPTSTMTADELLEDTHKVLTYMKRNGIHPRYAWRAAFTQNEAPEHEVLQPYLDAYATYKSNSGVELYPFRDRYNVNRVALHGSSRDNTYYDDVFDTLKKTRPLYVCYTHGLDDEGGIHMTNAQLDYLLTKIETGVNEGWLEGTTYSKLRGQYNFNDYSEIL